MQPDQHTKLSDLSLEFIHICYLQAFPNPSITKPKCDNSTSNLSDDVKHIEDEFHFLMKCSQYSELRYEMYKKVKVEQHVFAQLNEQEKFAYLLSTPSEAKIVAQYIVDAFDDRLDQF